MSEQVVPEYIIEHLYQKCHTMLIMTHLHQEEEESRFVEYEDDFILPNFHITLEEDMDLSDEIEEQEVPSLFQLVNQEEEDQVVIDWEAEL